MRALAAATSYGGVPPPARECYPASSLSGRQAITRPAGSTRTASAARRGRPRCGRLIHIKRVHPATARAERWRAWSVATWVSAAGIRWRSCWCRTAPSGSERFVCWAQQRELRGGLAMSPNPRSQRNLRDTHPAFTVIVVRGKGIYHREGARCASIRKARPEDVVTMSRGEAEYEKRSACTNCFPQF
jgi:hypothetical protein